MSLRLREANEPDLAALLQVERSCSGATHWSAAVWQEVMLSRSLRAVLVAEEAGAVVGFAVGVLLAGVAELEHLCVLAAHRRAGIGQALVEAVRAWALSQACTSLELEVRASNAAAIRFYARLGFSEQGRRSRYYSEPIEDAVLMALPLGPRV